MSIVDSSTAERIGLSPFEVLALDTQLDEAMPCEHATHLTEPQNHDEGPGVWYLQFVCEACEPEPVLLVCETFKELAMHYGVDCLECGREYPPGDGFTVVARK